VKTLISNTGGVQTFLELKAIDAMPGSAYLKITTTFTGAKDPSHERVKFDALLTQNELAVLKSALNEFSL